VKKWDEEFVEVDLYTHFHLGMACVIGTPKRFHYIIKIRNIRRVENE
jgi:hypothetical protein